MVSGKAPAATLGGFQGIGIAAAVISMSVRPASLLLEIHHGHRPADIGDGWLHCNIQVACHLHTQEMWRYYKVLLE
jgi:hypothetical protein